MPAVATLAVSATVLAAAGACAAGRGAKDARRGVAGEAPSGLGRLRARPGRPGRLDEIRHDAAPQRLTAADDAAALLYVPSDFSADRPAPLVVLLHGAGSHAHAGLAPLLDFADAAGIILLAPQASGRTWDAILNDYGADVTAVDALLQQAFSRLAVDASRVALGGFSDGASYALSLGLTNGDLFTHLIAFSPGFIAPASTHGRPRIYISHGVADPVLPIQRCSRRIVPLLRRAHYHVDYREFDAGHTVPRGVAEEAIDWLLAP